MKAFDDGVNTTVSYTNKSGGGSRCRMNSRLAAEIERVTGLDLKSWVQIQHDDIIMEHPRFAKCTKVLGCSGKNLSAREIGDIVRLYAVIVSSNNVSDLDL